METEVERLTCSVATVDGKFYGKSCLDRQRHKIKTFTCILILVIAKWKKDINLLS